MKLFPWKLKESGENFKSLCSHIILAEFDIATGSTVRHQYPLAIQGCTADWLAEHMLPEGAHNREIDYTYMLLNRNSKTVPTKLRIKQDIAEENINAEGKIINDDLLFGLNLCMTRFDATVKRGAIVKAISIFSPYNFIEELKPLLMVCLERYYDCPSVDVLKKFYESLNAVNLSCYPQPTVLEQLLMCRITELNLDSINKSLPSNDPLVWIYKLPLIIHLPLPTPTRPRSSRIVEYPDHHQDQEQRHYRVVNEDKPTVALTSNRGGGVQNEGNIGAAVTAVATITDTLVEDADAHKQKSQFTDGIEGNDGISVTSTPLELPLKSQLILDSPKSQSMGMNKKGKSREVLEIDQETQILQNLDLNKYNDEEESADGQLEYNPLLGRFDTTLEIPLFRNYNEFGDISIARLMMILGESCMKVFNAALAGRRLLFVGYNHSASDVAQMVVTVGSLLSPAITGVAHRLFPYGNLTDLSFLQVSGFIAGVTNPMFQENESWWDVVCILDLANLSATVRVAGNADVKRSLRSSGVTNHDESEHSTVSSTNGNGVVKLNSNKEARLLHQISSQLTSKISSSLSGTDSDDHLSARDSRFYQSCMAVLQSNSRFGHEDVELWLRVQFRDFLISTLNMVFLYNHINGSTSSEASSKSQPVPSPQETTVPTPSSGPIHASTEATRINMNKISQPSKRLYEKALSQVLQLKDNEMIQTAISWEWMVPTRSADNNLNDSSNNANRKRMLETISTLKLLLLRLQIEINLSFNALEIILNNLIACITSEQLVQSMVVMLPESQGGLHPIAVCLFSPHPQIRFLASNILTHIESYPSTIIYLSSLNSMYLSAYQRNVKKSQEGALLRETELFQIRLSARPVENEGDLDDAFIDTLEFL